MLRDGTPVGSGNNYFDFRVHMLADVTRIVWPALIGEAPSALAILPVDMATTVIALRYARAAGEADVAAWNAAVAAVSAVDTSEGTTSTPNLAAGGDIETGSGKDTTKGNDAPAANLEPPAPTPVSAQTSTAALARAPAGKRTPPRR